MPSNPLDAPWLFSMDPMTYREDGFTDDNNSIARISGGSHPPSLAS